MKNEGRWQKKIAEWRQLPWNAWAEVKFVTQRAHFGNKSHKKYYFYVRASPEIEKNQWYRPKNGIKMQKNTNFSKICLFFAFWSSKSRLTIRKLFCLIMARNHFRTYFFYFRKKNLQMRIPPDNLTKISGKISKIKISDFWPSFPWFDPFFSTQR